MYTIVNPKPIVKQRRSIHQPQPEVIDHNRAGAKYVIEKTWVEDVPYKTLRNQRDELLESELVYKKQLKELQKEKEELIKLYEPTYQENKQLKSILQHGPDAVKMKQLRKSKRELENELEGLQNDNKKLSEQMKALLDASDKDIRDKNLEQEWQSILTNGDKPGQKFIRHRRTQGKSHILKVNSSSPHKGEVLNETDIDTYDLQIDSVEKEIQILLNNVAQLKHEKKKVDYSVSVGKGALVSNPTLQNAINEKLENDLTLFKENVTNAQMKSDALKEKLEQHKLTKVAEDHPLSGRQSMAAIVKPLCNTIETQTDFEQHRSKSDMSSDRLPLRKPKKTPKRILQSRAVQTEFDKLELQENKPVPLQNINTLASRKTISTTKRRIEYADKLVTNRSYNHQEETEQDKQQDKSKQGAKTVAYNSKEDENAMIIKPKHVGNVTSRKSNHNENTGSKPIIQTKKNSNVSQQIIQANMVKTKATRVTPLNHIVSTTTKTQKGQSQNKAATNSQIEPETSKSYSRKQNVKHKETVTLKTIDQGTESDVSETEEIHDKIMDGGVLPKLPNSRYLSQTKTNSYSKRKVKKIKFPKSSSSRKNDPAHHPVAVDESPVEHRGTDLYTINNQVYRTSTPIYDIPDFKYTIANNGDKIHFRGKQATEMTLAGTNEDAYNEVLSTLTYQQRQANTNTCNDFNQTLQTYRDSKY